MASVFGQHGITIERAKFILSALMEKKWLVGNVWQVNLENGPEKVMYKPFVKIFQEVFSIIKYKDSSSRIAEDTSRKQQQHASSPITTKPDILIIGRNHRFLPPNEGLSLYNRTIVVGDVKLNSSHEGIAAQRAQIAVYARYVNLLPNRFHCQTLMAFPKGMFYSTKKPSLCVRVSPYRKRVSTHAVRPGRPLGISFLRHQH